MPHFVPLKVGTKVRVHNREHYTGTKVTAGMILEVIKDDPHDDIDDPEIGCTLLIAHYDPASTYESPTVLEYYTKDSSRYDIHPLDTSYFTQIDANTIYNRMIATVSSNKRDLEASQALLHRMTPMLEKVTMVTLQKPVEKMMLEQPPHAPRDVKDSDDIPI